MINGKDMEGSGGSIRNFPAGITEKQRKTSLLMTGSLAEIRSKTSRRQVWRLTPNTNILKKTGVRFSVGIKILVFADAPRLALEVYPTVM
jgi:hypothetical protein